MSKRGEFDPAKPARAREVPGTTIREPVEAAFGRARVAAVRDLVLLAEEGAFSALLELEVEDQLWG